MTTNNHPANGPVSLDRLHQISEILSKASSQSDGGNLGYAMADAVKVIDGAIAAFGAEPVAWSKIGFEGYPLNLTQKHELAYSWRKNGYAAMPLYAAPTAPVVPDEITPLQVSRAYGGEVRGYRDGWNACRAAMLQAGNSPVTPDKSTCKYCGGTGYFRWQQSENMYPCPCVGCDVPAAPQQ
ncbi:hypothetical protein QE82_23220 [Salmonella enterica subsp. enterica serovar Rubislaw]|nr:hypothetical protein [Salmonella enterica subsp. enterica serovar Rubislaw]